jgi:two-component system chemotaxis sensor kinase CheA
MDDNLLRRLLATFKAEAREHIEAIAAGLLELERTPSADAQSSVLDTTFRAAHSLKGAARTVNVRDIEALCQSLESVFAALRRNEVALSVELFDLLHRVVAVLGTLLQFTDAEPTTAQRPSIVDLLRSLQSAATKNFQPASIPSLASPVPIAELAGDFSVAGTQVASPAAARRQASDTIRVATAKLDAVLLQAEELLSAKLAAAQQATRLRQCRVEPAEWKKRWMRLRPDLRSLRQTLDSGVAAHPEWARAEWSRVMEFLDWSRGCMESLDAGLMEVVKVADHDQRIVGTMVDNLLDEMKKVVMQPFATLLDVLPRMVRELSREQGKSVELVIRGEDIEIDRRILEEMKDPLIHLIRNCVDHGIETPELRGKAGKFRQGTLTITIAAHDGSKVELLVADDGMGIEAATVKASALKQALLSAEQAGALNEQEALSLIFQSGVSTSPIITDISGRGLGLAIVKEKVEKLNGSLSVATEVGKGTTFRIILPVTLARFRGVLVRVSRNLFVLPTSNVERVLRVGKADIRTVENRETIVLHGHVTALARLAEILELPPAPDADEEPARQPVMVLAYGNQRIAFLIDEVLNEQEVLVKRLGKQLVRVRNVAGATVLGSGQVVPILNVADLIESAVHSSARGVRTAVAVPAKSAKKQSVLVVEDSITSRILLKNILETAGYRVETAVDGMDGLTKLRSGAFDLVVSDVEMPRMDGFGLTTQLRADKRLNQLPVILVTALDSREDRERGVDAGANAYIVKSSFDQSSLLEVVRRLI